MRDIDPDSPVYKDPVGLRIIDLSEMLESTLVLFHGRIAIQHIEVQRRLPEGVCVEASEGELRQVVVNLIGNALDAMPKGGLLILRVRRTSFVAGASTGVALTIADSGHGMTPEVKSRIFEAFYTTKADAGNGIGLWLSLEIVRKHRAKMLLKSAPGRGTAFAIVFPQNGAGSYIA